MEPLLIALPIMGIHLAAVMSPGPNFIIVSRSALSGSRQNGLKTAAGLGLGAFIWVSMGLLGVTWLIEHLPGIALVLKWVGGGYLAYLGLRILLKMRKHKQGEQTDFSANKGATVEPAYGFWTGLVTTLTNPKAAFYVLAVFTTMVGPETPGVTRVILGIVLPVISLVWYSVVATLFSVRRLQQLYFRVETTINLAFSLLLLYFAGTILTRSI